MGKIALLLGLVVSIGVIAGAVDYFKNRPSSPAYSPSVFAPAAAPAPAPRARPAPTGGNIRVNTPDGNRNRYRK